MWPEEIPIDAFEDSPVVWPSDEDWDQFDDSPADQLDPLPSLVVWLEEALSEAVTLWLSVWLWPVV